MRKFSPAIISALRGYGLADFLADLGAGLTVGLIALPLAIGFGIGSGVTPQQGLWTGIIASIVVALGGSRFQVAGPARGPVARLVFGRPLAWAFCAWPRAPQAGRVGRPPRGAPR